MKAGARRVDGRNRADCEMVLDAAPSVGRIVREVKGGFNMKRWEFPKVWRRRGCQDARVEGAVIVRTWGAAVLRPYTDVACGWVVARRIGRAGWRHQYTEVVITAGGASPAPTKAKRGTNHDATAAQRHTAFGGLLWSKKNDHYPWGKSLHGLGCMLVSSPVPPSYAPGG